MKKKEIILNAFREHDYYQLTFDDHFETKETMEACVWAVKNNVAELVERKEVVKTDIDGNVLSKSITITLELTEYYSERV